MKSPFEKNFWRADTLRSTWEYKTISFIWRVIVALIIILYLALTAPNVWPWMQVSYARSQPAEKFDSLLTQAIKDNDFDWTYRWLQARPQGEVQGHAATLEKYVADVPGMFLHTLTRASKQADDIEQQRFWLTYAQYRMRFDSIRCNMPGLIDKYDQIQNFAHIMSGQVDPMEATRRDPAKMAAMLQRVLDYDAKNPAANSPDFTCNAFGKIVRGQARIAPQETWATIRHTLRLATEDGIYELKKRASTAKPADAQPTAAEPAP